jgi:hypothetical protein
LRRRTRINLAPACYRDAKQERNKQAGERRFPGNGADGRERSSRLPRGSNGVAKSLNRGLKCCGDFGDRARHIGCGVDGAFGHTGLGHRLGRFDDHDRYFQSLDWSAMRPPPLAIRASARLQQRVLRPLAIRDRRRVERAAASYSNAGAGSLFPGAHRPPK